MYCPILKGKQYELAALRELVDLIPASNVCPVLEPVNLALGQLCTAISELSSAGINSWVVINPAQGEFSANPGLNITSELNLQIASVSNGTGRYLPCIKILDENDIAARTLLATTAVPFAAYVEGVITPTLLGELTRASVVLLNIDKNDHSIWRNLPSVVIYHDGFDKKLRNSDYGIESFYSSLHNTYRNYGNAIGFGDYTIMCERFIDGGGPAYVVTIHLSYLDPSRAMEMYVRHFSSYSDNDSQSDPGGKFREALDLLVSYVGANPSKFVHTAGLQDFLGLHASSHYPGLGIVKKLSIKHHVQTLSGL